MTEGETVADAKAAFDAMIDAYLTACKAEAWDVILPSVSVVE